MNRRHRVPLRTPFRLPSLAQQPALAIRKYTVSHFSFLRQTDKSDRADQRRAIISSRKRPSENRNRHPRGETGSGHAHARACVNANSRAVSRLLDIMTSVEIDDDDDDDDDDPLILINPLSYATMARLGASGSPHPLLVFGTCSTI